MLKLSLVNKDRILIYNNLKLFLLNHSESNRLDNHWTLNEIHLSSNKRNSLSSQNKYFVIAVILENHKF